MGIFAIRLYNIIEEYKFLEGSKRRKAANMEGLFHPARPFPSAVEEKQGKMFVTS